MFDNDKFIQLIQKQNSIWEMGSKQYMDRTVKYDSWMSVGSSMYPVWDVLEKHDKDKRGKKIYFILYSFFVLILTIIRR